jgi:hypothetical protein
MSAAGASGAGGASGSSGCKHGRPLWSGAKAEELVAMPSVPRRCGHPLGSRNKKTLAALVVAAALASFGTAAAAVGGPSGVTAMAASLLRRPPTRQPPAYTFVNGFVTFLVPVLAGDVYACFCSCRQCVGPPSAEVCRRAASFP